MNEIALATPTGFIQMPEPTFSKFNPTFIPWQWQATKCIRDFDYKTGILEILYSGGVGSAKTIHHIHEIILNCIEQSGSRWLMVRRTLKDLKRTSWKKLIRHLRCVWHLVKAYNKTDMTITFVNGSEIMGDSYHEGDSTKFQSVELSGLDIEEATEMEQSMYNALKERVGRAGVPINRIQLRCNPDEPAHWLYKFFIEDTTHPNKKVFYSITKDNVFLPPWYFENQQRDLDPLMARRKLWGEWLVIAGNNVYHQYLSAIHFHKDKTYVVNEVLPVAIFFDFNIGVGKPMSVGLGQYHPITDHFHIFDEVIIDGARTESMLEEIALRGHFDYRTKVQVYGDATGASQSTKSIHSDYDLIRKFLANYKRKDGSGVMFEMKVPASNPPIRERHNKVNAYLKNDLGEVRVSVYEKCTTLNEGFRLTALKKGAEYIEDDSKSFQHITTAAGYWITYVARANSAQKPGMRER